MVLAVALLVVGGVRGAVLSLEADGLVDEEVAGARVDGGRDGESNDDAWIFHEHESQQNGRGRVAAAHRGGSTRGGSTSDGEGAAKRCALRVDEIRVSLHIIHSHSRPMHSSSPILSSGLFAAPMAPSRTRLLLLLRPRVSPDAIHLKLAHGADSRTGIGRIMRAVGRNARRARVAYILDGIEWGGSCGGVVVVAQQPVRVFLESFGKLRSRFGWRLAAERSSVP